VDYELEQYYKTKILKLEQENKDLKLEYESAHKVEEHMAEQIAAQKRIIKKRNAVIKRYVDKHGILEEE